MHKNLILAVGITILFLCVSINPAIAVNPISSDSEEYCDCQPVSNQHLIRLKSLIDRLEKYDNQLSVRINTITEINNGLNTNEYNPIICSILLLLIFYKGFQYNIIDLFYSILYQLPFKVLSKIFSPLLYPLEILFINQAIKLMNLYYKCNCPPPWYY